MNIVLQRVNDVFFVVALLSLAIPFIFAYNSDISLFKAYPYVVALFIGFIIAWKTMPLKYACFFISFVVLLLSIEVGDAIHNDKTAPYYSISQMFRSEGISSAEIAFQPCSNGYRGSVGFYYNKLMRCSDNLNELTTDPKLRVVVTTQQEIDALIPQVDRNKLGRFYNLNQEFVVIIKSKTE
jgi:hypothetical protein